MTVFISAIVLVTVITSFLFYFISKRLDLCKKSLVIIISVLNVLFCTLFPLMIALFSGKAVDGSPSLNLGAVAVIMALWTVFYLVVIIWRVVLRSRSLKLNIPVPLPEQNALYTGEAEAAAEETADETAMRAAEAEAEAAAEAPLFDTSGDIIEIIDVKPQEITAEKDIYINNEKEYVDTTVNIDKMGNITELQQDDENNNVISLINRAFNSLEDGNLEEAAMHFYSAIEKKPPLSLEIQIAVQLSMVYSELGRADLSCDILDEYYNEYWNRLSDEDKLILETGVSIVRTVATSIGGNGDEKN